MNVILKDNFSAGNDWKLQKIIKTLNSTPENKWLNKAMIHDNQCITSGKSKAESFI